MFCSFANCRIFSKVVYNTLFALSLIKFFTFSSNAPHANVQPLIISMAEARQILRAALVENTQPSQNLAETIQKRFAELDQIPTTPIRTKIINY